MPVVVDASALIEVLLDVGQAAKVREAMRGAELVAPDVINHEVLSVLRRHERSGALSAERGTLAVRRLAQANIKRLATLALAETVWSLRENVSIGDAAYVALARRMGWPLLTVDDRLRRAPGLGVTFLAIA